MLNVRGRSEGQTTLTNVTMSSHKSQTSLLNALIDRKKSAGFTQLPDTRYWIEGSHTPLLGGVDEKTRIFNGRIGRIHAKAAHILRESTKLDPKDLSMPCNILFRMMEQYYCTFSEADGMMVVNEDTRGE